MAQQKYFPKAADPGVVEQIDISPTLIQAKLLVLLEVLLE